MLCVTQSEGSLSLASVITKKILHQPRKWLKANPRLLPFGCFIDTSFFLIAH